MTTQAQIRAFIARFTPALATQVRGARKRLHAVFPRGFELVYDNANALVFAYGPTPRQADLVLSIAVYPRWVNLFFARGSTLPDPHELLVGTGPRLRHVVLSSAADLDTKPLQALLRHALEPARQAFTQAPRRRTEIRAVSKKRRPRRPT
jgi:hypothetical protein